MSIKKLSAVLVAATLTVGLCAATPSASATAADPTGKYQAVAPSRIVDSRTGLGLPRGSVPAESTASFTVAGRGGVPATGVQSVVVNITVIDPSAGGWVIAYASGAALPRTSTVNFPAHWTGATTATVPVGADGKVNLAVRGGSVDVAVDVMGWYANASSTATPGSLFLAAGPERWYDSRVDGDRTRLAPGDYLDIPIEFDETGGRRLTAMQFNLTATGGFGRGWFTAWSGVGDPPATSALNFAAGETSPNLITVPVRRGGAVPGSPGHVVYFAAVENTSTSSAHLVVDAAGSFFTDPANYGTTHVVVPATRIGDSRSGVGMPRGRVSAGRTVNVAVPAGLLNARTDAFEGTITMANPSTASFLSLFAAGEPRPIASAVNTAAGRNRSNGWATYPGCVTTACTGAAYSVYNSTGAVNVILDVTGRFELTDEAIGAVGAPPAKPGANPAPRAEVERTAKLARTPVRR